MQEGSVICDLAQTTWDPCPRAYMMLSFLRPGSPGQDTYYQDLK